MSAKVGNDKENLDSVGDLNILLHDIVKCFGRFFLVLILDTIIIVALS